MLKSGNPAKYASFEYIGSGCDTVFDGQSLFRLIDSILDRLNAGSPFYEDNKTAITRSNIEDVKLLFKSTKRTTSRSC